MAARNSPFVKRCALLWRLFSAPSNSDNVIRKHFDRNRLQHHQSASYHHAFWIWQAQYITSFISSEAKFDLLGRGEFHANLVAIRPESFVTSPIRVLPTWIPHMLGKIFYCLEIKCRCTASFGTRWVTSVFAHPQHDAELTEMHLMASKKLFDGRILAKNHSGVISSVSTG